MKKTEFIKTLTSKLNGYPYEVIKNAASYYSELIDDAVEDGKTEEEIIASLGSIDDIVSTILKDVPLRKFVVEKVRPKHRLVGWEIALIVLGFPVWFPLLMAFISIFFSMFAVIWSVIVSLWAAEVGLLVGGVASTIGLGFMNLSSGPIENFAFYIGCGITLLGTGILLIPPMYYLSLAGIKLGKTIIIGIKKLFIGKGVQ